MGNLAALVSLLLLPGLVVAQIYAPNCSFSWTFNSLNQSPCTVAAYLLATCYGGSFSIASLPQGNSYQGPSATDTSNGTRCMCTTVVYSLLSACDSCQGDNWIDWSNYTDHCSTVEPPSTFPNVVPSGTRVPAWALLDITAYANKTWNFSKAFALSDSYELPPGAAISSAPSASTTTTTSTASVISPYPTSTSPSPSPSPSSLTTGHRTNVGAIAGGTVGSVVAVSIVVAVFYLRRRDPKEPSHATPVLDSSELPYISEAGQSLTDDGAIAPSSSATPMRFYDPNDPTTFPTFQPSAETLAHPSQVPILSYTEAGNTLASTQRARSREYRGLPIV